MSEPKKLQLNAGEAIRILDLERGCAAVMNEYRRARAALDQETIKALRKSGMDLEARWELVIGEDEVCLVEVPDEPGADANPED